MARRWRFAPPPAWLGAAVGELRRTEGPVPVDLAELAAELDGWELQVGIDQSTRAAAVAGVTGDIPSAELWRSRAIAVMRETAWRRVRARVGPVGGPFSLHPIGDAFPRDE